MDERCNTQVHYIPLPHGAFLDHTVVVHLLNHGRSQLSQLDRTHGGLDVHAQLVAVLFAGPPLEWEFVGFDGGKACMNW